jgi:hypothetical protein
MLYVPSLRMGTEVALNGGGSIGSANSMPSGMMYALAGFRDFTNNICATGVVGRG